MRMLDPKEVRATAWTIVPPSKASWPVDDDAGSPAKLGRSHELSLPKTELLVPGRGLRRDIVRRFARACDSVAPPHELFVQALTVDVTAREDAAVDIGIPNHLAGRRPLVHQGLEVSHGRCPALPVFTGDCAILFAHHRIDAEEHDALG